MLVTPVKKSFGRYKQGDHFELPEKAARKLILVGLVRAAVETESLEISPRTGLPKRQYRRRDMRAES